MNINKTGRKTNAKSSYAQTHTNSVSGNTNSESASSELVTAESLSAWRTYLPSMHLKGKAESKPTSNFRYMSFMLHAEFSLNEIISGGKLVSCQSYGKYVAARFEAPKPMTIAELDKYIDNVEEVEKVYTWIPTTAVNYGHRACYSSVQESHPHYKISVDTDDDGKFDTISVVVFDKKELLHRDLNHEIDYYLDLGGIFCPNRAVLDKIPALNLPPTKVHTTRRKTEIE